MRRTTLVLVLLAAVFAAAVVVLGTGSAEAARYCNCPDVFAPVICSNGRAYDNICYARCDHARDCVPLGD